MGPSGEYSGCDPSERSFSLRRRYHHREKPFPEVLRKQNVPKISDQFCVSGSVSNNSNSENKLRVGDLTEQNLQKRETLQRVKCATSSRAFKNKTINYFFSLGNGLILILIILLVCWLGLVNGGFPGRGPPALPHRGPPLLPYHPLAGPPSRSSPFQRRRLVPPPPPHHHRSRRPPPRPHNKQRISKKNSGPPSDLAVAAQTLYDLRGYHHLSGPDSPRFHRQNDPFTLPTPIAPNTRNNNNNGGGGAGGTGSSSHLQQDTRTAPLVFPSFYQEQPTPTPTRATIFGHNQHLSQTRFEPPGSFHLGGNSASGKITLEQQSSSSRDQFRPSQIDISVHNSQPTPLPPAFPSFVQIPVQSHPASSPPPENKLSQTTTRTRAPAKLSKNHQQDPFVYVYDEVDYDEGDDEDVPGGGGSRQRTPQNQINHNRITPSTSTTTPAPLRSQEPTILSSPNPNLNPFGNLHLSQQSPYNQHQQQQQHQYDPNPQLYYNPSSTTTKQPSTTSNSLFYDSQKDDLISPYRNPSGIIRPSVTPRPNVEIVPSSERRPPPDQSNAITPILTRNHGSGRQPPAIPQQSYVSNDNYDLRTRRPQTTTSTFAPPTPTALLPHYQRENIYSNAPLPLDQSQLQPQGRQVSPTPQPTPIPYFPAGLDRRPFEKQNEIPLEQTRNHFDQVVNILQEEDEEDFQRNNAVHHQEYNNPSKLRPVNTLIPKNRIPKEDIILPPNFPFTHVQNDLTSTLSPVVPSDHLTRIRGDPTQQRLRDKTRTRDEFPTRIREEKIPYRNQVPLNQNIPVRSRPSPVYFPEEEDLDDDFNLVTPAPRDKPNQPTSRIRARPTVQTQRTTTTTTTTTPAPPQSRRTVSPRQRLRPNLNRQSSTTQGTTSRRTTTTTPVPTFVEYPSQEYLDDYDQPYQSPSPPSQVAIPVVPQQQQKPLSRFPPFPNKNKEVVKEPISSSPPSPSAFQRNQPTTERGNNPTLRPGNRGRFRDGPPARELTTSPRTTGKPLYTTGKMFAKEGGVYAGHRITSNHVYGQPVSKPPLINDGRRITPGTTKPSFGSPQKHLRSKQRQPEHGPPSRINASGGQRIRPTVRAVHENTLDIVETVTLRPYQDDKVKSPEEPKRLRAGSQFVRGQNNQNRPGAGEKVVEGQQVLPRRRKVRPGRRQPQLQQQSSSIAPDAFTETVSIHQANEDEAGEEENLSNSRGQVIREQNQRNQAQEDEPEAPPPNQAARLRPRRPRPGKINNQSTESSPPNIPQRSREREDPSNDNNDEEQIVKPIKPVKKLRPRLRPVPVGQLQQQRLQQPSETVLQQAHSAQVDRKPTDAPGRFSSRFREDNYEQPVVSTTPRGDEDERESSSPGPNRFSPSNVRPTFRPPQKKIAQGRKRPQQNSGENEGDAIPESIKLSPKDVIANRKPARRIPPGSASDRLKALQQRRKKIFTPENDGEPAEGRQIPVTKRPGFRPLLQAQNEDDRPLPPQRLQQRLPHRQSAEAVGPKREVVNRASQQKLVQQEDEYYNNEDTKDLENDDKDEDNSEYDEVSSPPPPPRPKAQAQQQQQKQQPFNLQQQQQQLDRPLKSNGFHRNRSVEVTSDEARSVLGIPRPAAPSRQPGPKRLRNPLPEEDEIDDVQQQQQFPQNRPRLRPRLRQQLSQEQRERDQPQEYLAPQQLIQQQQRPRPGTIRPKTQFQLPQEQEDSEDSEYQDDDKEEPSRKPYLQKQNSREFSTSSVSPVSNRPLEDEEDPINEDEEEEEFPENPQKSTLVTTTTRTSSSSTSSQPQSLPVALPMRAGPLPIKQGVLKPRLRPNLKQPRFNEGGQQPRISITASTTEATITASSSSESTKRRPAGRLKAKSPHQRLQAAGGSGGGGGQGRYSKKFIAMATENPSLPLESIFPEMS